MVKAPDPNGCNARCYPVRIADRLPGAIIFPEVPGYPDAQVEIVAAVSLRVTLSLRDGDALFLKVNQPLSVRVVIFDVDGTLVDSIEAYRQVAEQAIAPYGIPVTSEVVRRSLNTGEPSFWELVVPQDQSNRIEVIKEVSKEAAHHWPEVLSKYGRVYPGLRQTLEILQSRGFRLGIMTSSQGTSLQPLREAELLDFFEIIITSKDIKQRKPNPEGILKVIAALNVEPNEAVYVGDTCVDVQASRAAGMAAVSVLCGAGDSALLSMEGPDWIIQSPTDLPEILLNCNER